MTAPLRIYTRRVRRGLQPAPQQTLKDYLERLVKLIPAEVVGIYLIGIGMVPQNLPPVLALWAVICLMLVIFVRSYATWEPKKGPQWVAVSVASISFVIWAYTMGGPFQAYGMFVPWIGSLAVLVWTFMVPYIYKGDAAT